MYQHLYFPSGHLDLRNIDSGEIFLFGVKDLKRMNTDLQVKLFLPDLKDNS